MILSIEPNDRVTFKVRHEDRDVLVADKPAGLVTQPGRGHERDTLLNGLFARHGVRLQQLGRDRDFGLLHRLDKQTSGLLVVALTRDAYDTLRVAFEQRRVRKYYWAVTGKAPNKPSGVIRRPILEEGGDEASKSSRPAPKTARVAASGKPALTAYRVIDSNDRGALVECRPVTGRLHQVRVHLESIGCPILGDDVYAPRWAASVSPRLALHAHRLAFAHPRTGETIDVESPLPRDIKSILKRLGLSASADRAHQVGGDAVGEQEPRVGETPSA